MTQPEIMVESSEVQRISGTSKNNGRAYEFYVQNVLLFLPSSQWPDKAEIMLPRDRHGIGYSPGRYCVDTDVFVDRQQRLTARPGVGKRIADLDGSKSKAVSA